MDDNGQKSYEMQQAVQPGDQVLVNVAELIRTRVADRKGNVLPADLSFGTYDVKDLGSGHGSLSVGALVLDQTWGYRAAAVPSPDCCGFGAPVIDPSAVDLSVGGVESVGVDALDQCTNEEESIFTDITTWWSGNITIAQVTTGQVTGVSPGTTTANGSGEILECYGNTEYFQDVAPSAPVTVQVPTSLKVVNATILQTGNSGNHGCPSGYYGIGLDIDYQVLDQNSNPIQSSAMTPQEYIVWYDGTNNGGFTNIGPTYISTTSPTTRADGTFDDAPVELCKALPFNTPLTSTQTIQVLYNSQTYQVRTNNWKFSSTNLTNHGTITNGVDVNKTQ